MPLCRDKISVSLDTLTKLTADPNMWGSRQNAGYDTCAACVLYHPASLTRVFRHTHTTRFCPRRTIMHVYPPKSATFSMWLSPLATCDASYPRYACSLFAGWQHKCIRWSKNARCHVQALWTGAQVGQRSTIFTRLSQRGALYVSTRTPTVSWSCVLLCIVHASVRFLQLLSITNSTTARAPSTYALYATYKMYFLILARMILAVSSHCCTIYMRTRLSTMVPAYKDVRVPVPSKLPPSTTGDSTGAEWNTFRAEIFEHAMTVVEEATSLRPLVVQPARAVDTPKTKFW